MPDTYTSQFSGEEIDAALRAAQIISGASTLAELRKKLEIRGDTIPVSAEDSTLISEALTKIPTTSGGGVNPNLLDNWFFGRPVNQRGQTSYGQTQQYSIDRWMITNDYAYVDVADGYITLRGNDVNGFGGIIEKLESSIKNALLGKTATLSFFAKLYTTCAIAGQQITPTDDTDNFELYSVTFSGSSADYVMFNAVTAVTKGAKIADILAAKLELGDTQTLAHKENGVWVLNEIPDFGEQLRRCQRYHLGDMQRDAPGRISENNTAYCVVPIPVTMRQSSATPVQAISKYGTLTDKDGASHVVNNAYCVVEADSYLLFAVVSTETMPVGPCVWQDAHFSVSKDL